MSADLFALFARPRVLYVTRASTAAALTQVPIAAPVHKIWIVLYATAYQGSGGDRLTNWRVQDPDQAVGKPLYADTVKGSGIGWPYTLNGAGATSWTAFPAVVAGNRYLTFEWTALGAGENGYVQGMVLELPAGHTY